MELDQYLSRATRRLRVLPRAQYVIGKLQSYYATKYEKSRNSWTVITDFDGDLRFKLNRASLMGNFIYWNGYFSIHLLPVLDRLLKPQMVLADIGANQEEITLYAAKRLPYGNVMAFEPIPSVYQHLSENIRLNRFTNVQAYNYALSNHADESEMYAASASYSNIEGLVNEGVASLFGNDEHWSGIGKVKTETFDAVFEQSGLNRLDVMKVDVEGAELPVLQGASASLKQYKPTIFMEVCEENFNRAGYTTRDVSGFLIDLGYQLFVITDRRDFRTWRFGKIVPVDGDNLPVECDIVCRYMSVR